MLTGLKDQFITISTNHDDWFTVTIRAKTGHVIFSEVMRSLNKQIVLKGFSLVEESITISPIK
jgi:hypothetical protein